MSIIKAGSCLMHTKDGIVCVADGLIGMLVLFQVNLLCVLLLKEKHMHSSPIVPCGAKDFPRRWSYAL